MLSSSPRGVWVRQHFHRFVSVSCTAFLITEMYGAVFEFMERFFPRFNFSRVQYSDNSNPSKSRLLIHVESSLLRKRLRSYTCIHRWLNPSQLPRTWMIGQLPKSARISVVLLGSSDRHVCDAHQTFDRQGGDSGLSRDESIRTSKLRVNTRSSSGQLKMADGKVNEDMHGINISYRGDTRVLSHQSLKKEQQDTFGKEKLD